jgi:sporulation protein YlmC with PRC-barrel domain
MIEDPRLRYIDAGHVEGRADDLSGFEVVTEAGEKLGALDGLIVDPPERRIRYFVVHPGWFGRRRLVPVSSARLDLDRRAVEVDLETDDDCPTFDARTFPRFSETDLLSAMFRRTASIH